MLCLPRLSCSNVTFTPLSCVPMPFVVMLKLRTASPVSGGSILMTSAPISANIAQAEGAATQLAISRTLTPCSVSDTIHLRLMIRLSLPTRLQMPYRSSTLYRPCGCSESMYFSARSGLK